MNEQQMTPMEGFNVLAKDVLPKIIARVKELDSRVRDMQGDMQEDLAEIRRRLQELEGKPKPATRVRKKKKEAEAEPAPTPASDDWTAMLDSIRDKYAAGMTPEDIAVELDAPLELIHNALEV